MTTMQCSFAVFILVCLVIIFLCMALDTMKEEQDIKRWKKNLFGDDKNDNRN